VIAGKDDRPRRGVTRRDLLLTHGAESFILHTMTKRLQVHLQDDELSEIQALARRRRQTTAAWVRDALRAARAAAEYPTVETKLKAVREAAALAYPSGDIEEMLAETERGYVGETPPPAEPRPW
jgi:hypothetical protein